MQTEEKDSRDISKVKKSSGKGRWTPTKIILAILAGLLVVALLVLILFPAGETVTNILSIEAVTGDITTTVVGSGRLDYGEKLDVLVPAGLKIDRVMVETGDYVEAGDELATFDPASVQAQIETVEADLKSVDRDINNSKGEKVSSYVYAQVSGRVKIIYAETGEETADVVERYGSLMVLSIDGKMAVDISTDIPLKIGDKLSVKLSDGRKREGRVETVAEKRVTVTLDDYGPADGDRVSVETLSGEPVATGTLYIHQPISIYGSSGRIAAVYVSKESYVYSGTTLLRMEEVGYSAAYQQLLAKREELSATLGALIAISRTHSLLAPFSGAVQSVAVTNGGTTSSPQGDYRMAAIVVASGDTMVLSIDVDELDILSILKGQVAAVSFDAIDGEIFAGVITHVSDFSSTTNGSARYKVTIEVQRDGSMRAGMNATAVITVGFKSGVVLIPLAAIQERDGREFVYLSVDANGNLGDERDVQTGLADGRMVEIVSGLRAGERVCYAYTSGESDTSLLALRGGPGGMGGGERGGSEALT